jgi:hypothetical protein
MFHTYVSLDMCRTIMQLGYIADTCFYDHSHYVNVMGLDMCRTIMQLGYIADTCFYDHSHYVNVMSLDILHGWWDVSGTDIVVCLVLRPRRTSYSFLKLPTRH